MMPERCRYWIVVAVALCTILSPVVHSESSRARQRELDRAENLLRDSLKELPPDSAVAIVRDEDHVTLRFSAWMVFESDSSALKMDARSSLPLSAAVRLLKRRHALSAQISVYTDNIGGDSANLSFSAARAKALCSTLVAAGIAGPRLHEHGAGASDALSSNSTPEGRTENRRVEIAFAPP
jgi:outer membrane protein OmpA-like peptidoglycan-associated protein